MRILKREIAKTLLFFMACVFSASAFSSTPATMADYWAGNANWELVKKRDFFSNYPNWTFDSSTITVVGSTWYIFSRTNTPNSNCPRGSSLGTAVQKSTDFGATWSSPVTVLSTSANSAQTCAATDGSAFYDSVNNKFRFLYQCMNTSGTWNGCYAELAGSDATNTAGLTYPLPNPVIQSGSLWGTICNSGDDCYAQAGGANKVFEEGTFDIFYFDGTKFWISFHGFDNTRGYRGIATTSTFAANSYSVNGMDGTPNDAFIDKNDAATWRENWKSGGAIGAGGSSTLIENGYFYTIAEVADISLNCLAGQNWNAGLFRSSSLSSTNWQQFPLNNPILYSSTDTEGGATSLPCNLQYVQLFKGGDGYIYLKYYRDSADWHYRGTYFYRLAKSTNLLKNADLWMADTTYWNRLPGNTPNYTVYRYPNLSPDGTQVMASNCGTSTCNVGQSIYQDVDVTGLNGRSFTFGGQFSALGGTGALDVVVVHLDANFNVLQTNVLNVSASSGSYTNSASGVFTISSGAKYLRYQYYMKSPTVTYLADNMYINLN